MLRSSHRAGLVVLALLMSLLVALAPGASSQARISSHHPGVVLAQRNVPRLAHRGKFLVDDRGRVVTLHGINMVWKLAPHAPPRSAKGFTARDADFLARNGFNAVRLGVLFAGVMPTEGKIDQHYLTQIDRVVQLLTKRHIWVLLDFHQDAFNEKFKGEGFPDWAVHDDGLPFVDAGSFFANYQTPAVERVFDHFWANDFHLVDMYAKAWQAVARKWRDQPYLMGYDLFNEPSAGSRVATCANPLGCPGFDANMQGVYHRIRKAIRRVDRRNMVWYEPQFYFNALSKGNFTRTDDPRVGLSWHDYACTPAFVAGGVVPGDPDCAVNEPRVMANAADQVARLGAGSLLSEFGAGDDLTDLVRLTKLADERLTGWMYWAYKTWDDPTGSPDEGLYAKDDDPSTLKVAKLKTLERAYAPQVAGTPTSVSWAPTTRVMRLTYRATAHGLTRLFVPRLLYPHGYRLTVTGAHRSRGTFRNPTVRAGRAVVVTVTIGP